MVIEMTKGNKKKVVERRKTDEVKEQTELKKTIDANSVLKMLDDTIGIEYKTNEKYSENYVRSKEKKLTFAWVMERKNYVSISVDPKFNDTDKWQTTKVANKEEAETFINKLKGIVDVYNPPQRKVPNKTSKPKKTVIKMDFKDIISNIEGRISKLSPKSAGLHIKSEMVSPELEAWVKEKGYTLSENGNGLLLKVN
jgi:hypothetical protein